jgi:hypothetical protein
MLELLTGSVTIKLNQAFDQSPPPNWRDQNDPPFFCLCPKRPYQLRVPTPTDLTAAPGISGLVVPGHGAVAQRNFTWLPFMAGRITYAPLGGTILTGKMSGCWLVTFAMNGGLYLGHIGTDNMNRQNTEDVKNAWKIAFGRGLVKPIKAFNPLRHVPDAASIFGAVTDFGAISAIAFDEPVTNRLKLKKFVTVPGVREPQLT